MNKITTLNNLTEFYRTEKQILNSLGLASINNKNQLIAPKQVTIDFLINYSKALSIRKSNKFGMMEFILN